MRELGYVGTGRAGEVAPACGRPRELEARVAGGVGALRIDHLHPVGARPRELNSQSGIGASSGPSAIASMKAPSGMKERNPSPSSALAARRSNSGAAAEAGPASAAAPGDCWDWVSPPASRGRRRGPTGARARRPIPKKASATSVGDPWSRDGSIGASHSRQIRGGAALSGAGSAARAQRRGVEASIAFRFLVNAHQGSARPPSMKSTIDMNVSRTHGSWRWPVARQRAS